MNSTHLLAVEVPLAARLIEMLDDGEAPMDAGDYRAVSSQLIDSLTFVPTGQLLTLAREHSDYGPADLVAPRLHRRLRVLGELAQNVVFSRIGRLADLPVSAAEQAQREAHALLARVGKPH